MRTSTVREMGARAQQVDSEEQQRITDQLVQQIRTEPDPLVRLAIQETVAQFDTPMAQMVLLAGLNDDDRDVRIVCCRKLGQRATVNDQEDDRRKIVTALQRTLEQDKEIDVRFAAVDALGKIQTTDSVRALAVALHDHDPAMQYAGVQALKRVSGQDFGNTVEAWRQYADGESPQIRPALSVVQRMKEMMPF
jgi:HEAT repeat protein